MKLIHKRLTKDIKNYLPGPILELLFSLRSLGNFGGVKKEFENGGRMTGNLKYGSAFYFDQRTQTAKISYIDYGDRANGEVLGFYYIFVGWDEVVVYKGGTTQIIYYSSEFWQ
jgi:hypothetical protein